MRKASNWLDRQPLRLYVPITFVIYCLIAVLVAYVSTWLIAPHHPIPGELGFANGHLSVTYVLIFSAVTTTGITLRRLVRAWIRRRARQGNGY